MNNNKKLKNITYLYRPLIWAITGMSLSLLISCFDEPISLSEQLKKDLSKVDQAQLELDTQEIDAYLEDKGIVAEIHSSGLRYVIKNPGFREQPKLSNTVEVLYKGKLFDGTIFDENPKTPVSGNEVPVEFPLNGLILAWQIGIPLVQVGGNLDIYAPSGLCYGPSSAGSLITPNSNLIFEIDLLGVK